MMLLSENTFGKRYKAAEILYSVQNDKNFIVFWL
jgi:hypothetical protein